MYIIILKHNSVEEIFYEGGCKFYFWIKWIPLLPIPTPLPKKKKVMIKNDRSEIEFQKKVTTNVIVAWPSFVDVRTLMQPALLAC